MRIALDATLWDEPTTGIGLYTHALYEALASREDVEVERVGARYSGEHPRHTDSRTAFVLSELPEVLTRSEATVFHAVGNFNLPLTRIRGKRYVLTVHDLIPELFPETVSRAYRWQFRLMLARALQVADQVICVSRRTREDLLYRYDLDADRVHVVYNGVDHVDRVPPPDEVGMRYLDALGLPERFVLYAGSLDVRKNVGLLLDALEALRRRGVHVPLVLAGQSWFGSGEVERRIANMRAGGMDIRPLGYLDPAVFYAVMRRARVFVFPSLYEGFGLPPLEAMRLGVPCIVSTGGALPEVCGEAALYTHPRDAAQLGWAIEKLLEDDAEHARLAEAGRKQAARFTWADTAERTLKVYRRR